MLITDTDEYQTDLLEVERQALRVSKQVTECSVMCYRQKRANRLEVLFNTTCN